jgi:hypothetical protein
LYDFLSTGRHFVKCFVYNKPKVKLVHSSSDTEHYRK